MRSYNWMIKHLSDFLLTYSVQVTGNVNVNYAIGSTAIQHNTGASSLSGVLGGVGRVVNINQNAPPK